MNVNFPCLTLPQTLNSGEGEDVLFTFAFFVPSMV